MGRPDLDVFFFPQSVAIVGASREPTKVGYQILYNMKMRYRGRLYPVNPKATEILGLRCYPSVSAIPDTVDLAVIAVPAPKVPDVVDDCGKKGVKGVIVISAGFKEVGNVELERKLVEVARKHGIRVIGPNCVGVYVPKSGMNTTFLNPQRMGFPEHGHIAFISQSGAFGVAVLDWAAMRGLGLSKFVSLGNKADVDESELLDYLVEDPDTRVITMYIEGVEPGKGRQFMEALKRTTPRKPVVVLKSGRSEAGARAIASHTGSLAGADRVYDAVFKQTGVIRAMGMEELFDVAVALSLQPPAKGRRVAILTVGGGSGVMATDACCDLGLEVPRLSDATVEKLRKVLLPIASPYNPVDVSGSARDEHLTESVEILMKSGEIDAIIWIPYFMVPGISEQIVEKFVERVKKVNRELDTPIPIVGAATGGDYTWKLAAKAEKMGIPMYLSVERAAKAIWALAKYGEWLKKRGTFEQYVESFRKLIGY
ncbi:MAG: CoA-binding protein [Crenarchaeota archaeon]|nr:CoA-binding protein [Thermoproteota archaeon]